MLFSIVSITLLGFASSVIGQTPNFDVITSPAQGQYLEAGSSFDIIWEPNSVPGTITITLIEGKASNLLQPGGVVASGIDNLAGKFTWSPVPSSNFAAYGFNISLDSDPSTYQLSNGFHIRGTATTTTLQLAPGPSYSVLPATSPTTSPTTTSSTTPSTSPSVVPSVTSTPILTSSSVVKPSFTPTTNFTVTSNPTLTTSYTTPTVTPSGSETPVPSPPKSNVGAATNVASVGLAAIGGLLLALVL